MMKQKIFKMYTQLEMTTRKFQTSDTENKIISILKAQVENLRI